MLCFVWRFLRARSPASLSRVNELEPVSSPVRPDAIDWEAAVGHWRSQFADFESLSSGERYKLLMGLIRDVDTRVLGELPMDSAENIVQVRCGARCASAH